MAQILIVDDDPALRTSMRFALEDEGHVVFEADDGENGLRYLRATLEPHVVLLDLLMPRLNGAEVLEHVAQEPPLAERHAFLMLTAQRHNLTPDNIALLQRMQVPVMDKPYELGELLETVETMAHRLPGS